MPKTRALFVCLLAACLPALLRGQTPTPTPTPSPSTTPTPTATPAPFTTPTGQTWSIDGTHPVNGTRFHTTVDGATWFLVPSVDRIVKLQGGTMTQWPIRATDQIGANPVDFQFDGTDIWFIENGESQIAAGLSIIGKLDTTTGNLLEYVLPISIPAGFYRTPDGKKMWVAQTAGVLELVDLETLAVTDYRANPVSFAGTMTLGPDGALWMTDFANNRIIRHDMSNDTTEKAWTILDPSVFQVRPADARFDEDGKLWITEFAGGRIDRFDPATGELRSYVGFTNPIHLDFYGGNVYVASADGTNGKVTIIDPRIAPYSVVTLASVDLPIVPLARPNAHTRQSVITPVPFTPTTGTLAAGTDLTLSAAAGFLLMTFNKTNAFGISVAGGAVWTGTDSEVVLLQSQTIGGPTDQTIPVALQAGTPPADPVRVDLTLFNRGAAAISGTALFQYSAAAYPQPRAFTLPAGGSALLSDAFVGALTGGGLLTGSVRLQVTSGNAADLVALARTARALPNGTFGTSLRAESSGETLSAGANATLFTGVKPTDLSTLGIYSPSGGTGTLQLVAPDGTVRGSRTVRVESNNLESHNPVAAFFGVTPEPGDVVRVSVTAGSLQPWVLVQDAGTRDIAIELPTSARTDAVVPNVASVTLPPVAWLSGLQVSNPDTTRGATVTVTYYPLGGAPASGSFVVPPGATAAYADVVADLIHAPPGQGSLVVTSDAPVAASFRNAARSLADGTEYAAASRALDGAAPIPETGSDAPDVYASPTRRTNLLLFNRGAAGTVTLTAYDADGASVGQLALPIAASSSARVDRVLAALGAPVQFGRIRIQPSAGMKLYAQTVNVDPGTGDSDLIDVR